jgi:ABC-2 type transport system permease protein
MNTPVGRLVRAELRLMTRDPLVLTFVFAFPIVTMLIIGGAFGTTPDRAFEFTNPSHWYVASYLTVVIAATGLVMLPVHLALLLAVAAPVYGIPAVHDGWRVAVALPLGAIAFVSIGVLLGSLLPSARAAQAVGLLLFFPSFLLGAGGPPPHVMGSAVKQVAGPLPLTLLTNAVREPWLGLGPATGSLIAVAVLAVAASVLAVRRIAL